MARRRKPSAEERLNRYKADIEWGKRAMRPLWEEWRRAVRFYEGDQWDDDTGQAPDNAVVVNQIGPIVNTILPSIYTNQPRPRVKALRPQDAHTSDLVEAVITYDWRRLGVDEQMRLAGLDAILLGNGLLMVGYEYEEADVRRDPSAVQADFEMMRAIVQALGGGTPPQNVFQLPELGAAMQRYQGIQEPQFLHGYGHGGLQRVPQAYQQYAAQGGQPGLGQQTMEQAAGQPYQAQQPGGQQPALPPMAGPETPAVEEPPGTPPALAALVREEGGGPPAEDAYDPNGPPPIMDATQTPSGPGSEPLDPSLLPTEQELWDAIPTTVREPTVDDIFVERVSPFDVVIDPEAKSLADARWVARRRWLPLEEVKASTVYSNTADLKGSLSYALAETEPSVPPPGYPDQGSNPDWAQRVEVWERYDTRDGTLCVLVLDHDKFLLETQWDMPFTGGPLVLIRDYLIPDKPWGYGEAKLIIDLQVELNRTRTQIINHNRRFNRKILYNERAIQSDGIQALESPRDGVLVRVTGDVDLSKAVLPLPDSQLPPDRYQLSNIIEADITQVTGISDYERGAYNNIRRTATEASIIQDSSTLRQQDKLRRIEDAATEVARRMKSLAQMFYDRQRWILITGQGWEVPVSFNRTDILGEFDVSVDAGSTQPISQQQRMQDAERLYQLLAANPFANLPELTRELLRAHGMQNPDRFLNQMAIAQAQMMGVPPGQQGGQQGLPGQQPGQLGPGTPQEVQGGVQGGAAAAGVPGATGGY